MVNLFYNLLSILLFLVLCGLITLWSTTIRAQWAGASRDRKLALTLTLIAAVMLLVGSGYGAVYFGCKACSVQKVSKGSAKPRCACMAGFFRAFIKLNKCGILCA